MTATRPIHAVPFGVPLAAHRASSLCRCEPDRLRELLGEAPVYLHRAEPDPQPDRRPTETER